MQTAVAIEERMQINEAEGRARGLHEQVWAALLIVDEVFPALHDARQIAHRRGEEVEASRRILEPVLPGPV